MRRAYLVGLQLALQCCSLAAILWLISVGFGTAFFVTSGYWLDTVLDGSLATRTLLYDLDPNVFIDLYYRQDSGFRMLIGIGCVMAAIYLLLWCWLHGVVIFKTYSKGRMPLSEAFLRGVQTFFSMLQLLLVALTVLAAWTTLIGVPVWLVMKATATSPSEMIRYYIVGAAAVVWLGGCVFLTAIHDHARIRVCHTLETPLAAYWWAVSFVTRGGEHAFLLALALQLTAVLVGIAFQTASLTLRADAGLGMAIVFFWGELSIFVRMIIRLWFFAAQGDLQSPA